MRKRVSFGWFYVGVAAVCAALLIFRGVFHPVSVSGVSMEPTYHDGDLLQMQVKDFTVTYDSIVIFKADGRRLIKRVVAVDGDTVQITDGVLYVNGKTEDRAFDLIRDPGIASSPYTVPEGCVFVLGDNRNFSRDSRVFGAVPVTNVQGVVIRSLLSRN